MFRCLFKKKTKQTTFCYCPECKNELISSGSFSEESVGLYKAKCTDCGEETEWLFETPVPVLIK